VIYGGCWARSASMIKVAQAHMGTDVAVASGVRFEGQLTFKNGLWLQRRPGRPPAPHGAENCSENSASVVKQPRASSNAAGDVDCG